MKIFCFQVMLLAVFQLSCQRSSGVSDDSETVDTDTYTDVTPASDSTDTGEDTETVSESESDSATEDTEEDTGSDTTLPEPVENEWIFIEGGTFEVGYDDSDGYDDSHEPAHTVTVPSFEIQKTEVTTYQYRQCVNDGACSEPHQSEDECKDSRRNNWLVPSNLNYPVNCIDHYQATEYCDWIGGRLLSEAEWEYAARGGGQDIKYPWGNDPPDCTRLAAIGDSDAIGIPSCWSEGPLPVCSKPLGNSFHGLCDMSGNYQEWVADQCHVSASYEDAPTDGTPRIIADSQYAMVRSSDAFFETTAHQVYVRTSEKLYSGDSWDVSVRCGKDEE